MAKDKLLGGLNGQRHLGVLLSTEAIAGDLLAACEAINPHLGPKALWGSLRRAEKARIHADVFLQRLRLAADRLEQAVSQSVEIMARKKLAIDKYINGRTPPAEKDHESERNGSAPDLPRVRGPDEAEGGPPRTLLRVCPLPDVSWQHHGTT
jgi:hypothetical protein